VEVLRFSLERKERSVILETKEGGETFYTLRELDGAGREAYFEYMSNQTLRDEKGKGIGFKPNTNLRIKLVSLCLYNEKGQVSIEEVAAFPGGVLKELDEAASKLNGFGEEAVKEAEKK